MKKTDPSTCIHDMQNLSGKSWICYGALFAISVGGLMDAAYLSRVHLSLSRTCAGEAGCWEVLASSWSTIGGMPVAALGAGMYLSLAWLSVQILRRRETLPFNEPWMFIISAIGFGASAFFTVLQIWVIRKWCPFCLLSAALATAFFLVCLSGGLKTGSLRSAIKGPKVLYRGLPWALAAFVLPPFIVLSADREIKAERKGDANSGGRIVGFIDGRKYTLADVDRAIRGKLQQLDEQRYRVRRAYLDESLLALEASRRGLKPQELIQKEVIDNISADPDEVMQFIFKNQSRLSGKISPALKRQIEKRIIQKKTAAARENYIQRLKAKYGARYLLPLPERLTVEAAPRGGPVKGPTDAPVTVVVFTDFECPFCRRAHQELQALMGRFPGKIRLAFRHFPLQNHRWAGRAAELACCVHRQGRFWSFADSVFSHRAGLSEEILSAYVRRSGITDMESLNQCLQSGLGKREVNEDIAEGKNLGVQGTPSLFINGRFFSGMPKDIDAVIQEEIERRKDMG